MPVPKWLRIGAFAVLLLGLSACSLNDPQSTFDTHGPVARSQLRLFMLTLWWSIPVMLAVFGALFYSLFRFRQRQGDNTPPEQVHGNVRLELVWTVLPVFILIAIGVPTVRTIFHNQRRLSEADMGNALQVTAIGHQWWWEFEYPELGITTANQLHIPVGRTVNVRLRSADVLHSFWIPKLAGKRDLIPNQDNQLWFSADEAGIYNGQCAEYCLGAHAYMRFRVVAQEEHEFLAWADTFQGTPQQVSADPLVQRGQQLFVQKGCVGCHAVLGLGVAQNRVGPDLSNFGERLTVGAAVLPNTRENLARWIRNPQEVKPGNYMPVLWRPDDPNAAEEANAIAAYLQSLGREDTRQALRGDIYGY